MFVPDVNETPAVIFGLIAVVKAIDCCGVVSVCDCVVSACGPFVPAGGWLVAGGV